MMISIVQGKEPSFDTNPGYRNGVLIAGRLVSLYHFYRWGGFKRSMLQIRCREGRIAFPFFTPLRVPESWVNTDVSFYEFAERLGPFYRKQYTLTNKEDNLTIEDSRLGIRKWYNRGFSKALEDLYEEVSQKQEATKC